MSKANLRVLLDACVLAPAGICDLLLSLAETPRLYVPVWSEDILAEVRRTHIAKLGWPEQLADYWQEEVRRSFPEARVDGYEPLIAACQNHEKNRHVLAAAIKAGVGLIVTSNLRHFPVKSLEPWNLSAMDPANYLITLYTMEPGVMLSKLASIARRRGISPQEALARLGKALLSFARHVAAELCWKLPNRD